RANEHEADRLGIRALARSGYDVDAMADFFARMSFATRGNSGGYSVPEYLRTHPVNTTRIAEAKQRADQMRGRSVTATTTVGEVDGETVSRVERVVAEPPAQPQLPPLLAGRGNPLLPAGLELASLGGSARPSGATGHFEWARERLRALSATTTDAAVREYEALRRASPSGLSPAQRYGLAVVRLSSEPAAVAGELRQLLEEDPQNLWVALALAEAEAQAGRTAEANARLDQLLQRHPGHRAVVLTYAKVLVAQGNEAAGKRAQEVLRPLLARSGNDPVFQRTFAR